MAKVCITEYDKVAVVDGQNYPAFAEPPLVIQTAKTSIASSTQSSTFNSKTRGVRLTTDTAIHFLIGINPTATTDCPMIASNQGIDLFVRLKGQKIAVIAA